jgi:hypothetical protein
MKHLGNIIILALFFLITQEASANRLADAASKGSSMVISIAQTTSGIGIALGAILLSLGMGQLGKNILTGGAIGAFVTFGGPAIVDFMKELF